MKRLKRNNDEELRILDTINKMSRQIYFTEQKSNTSAHSQLLAEVIENLEEQLLSLK